MAMQEMTHRGGRTPTMAVIRMVAIRMAAIKITATRTMDIMASHSIIIQGNNSPGRGYSIACLILGICGIVFCFCYGIVGVICSIVALVLHGKAVELDGFESSYAKAGKICAIIGIVIGVIYLILTILAVVFSMSVGGLSTMLRA